MVWLGMAEGGDESHASVMIRNAVEAIRDLDHAIRGNGGPGLAEQIRTNRAAIESIKKKLEAAEKDNTKLQTTRWATIGQIAVALVAFTTLALQLFGG